MSGLEHDVILARAGRKGVAEASNEAGGGLGLARLGRSRPGGRSPCRHAAQPMVFTAAKVRTSHIASWRSASGRSRAAVRLTVGTAGTCRRAFHGAQQLAAWKNVVIAEGVRRRGLDRPDPGHPALPKSVVDSLVELALGAAARAGVR